MKQLLFFISILSLPVFAQAQKTDTIWFYNGDRAICEIKSLNQGRLRIKTVAMGTISVEWRKIDRFTSNKYFEIGLSNHTRIYGKIMGTDSLRNVHIQFGIFEESVPILNIVNLKPLNQNFWKELDGSLNAGFSYTLATKNYQINSSGEAKYRTNRTAHQLSFTNNLSGNELSSSRKQDGGYRFQFFFKRLFYNALALRWERNTRLGIESRFITTISAGYSPVENNFNVLSVDFGGSINRELSTEGVTRNNAELLLRITYDLFIFEKPKIFLKIKSESFPSMTVQGRFRSNIDSSLSWEVFNNFTLGISYWGNFDSVPANTTGLTYDWGTTTNIGYTF